MHCLQSGFKLRSFQELCFILVTFFLSKIPEFVISCLQKIIQWQEFQISKIKALCSCIGPVFTGRFARCKKDKWA